MPKTKSAEATMTNIHVNNKAIWPQCRYDEFHHLPSSSENQLLGYFPPRDIKADRVKKQNNIGIIPHKYFLILILILKLINVTKFTLLCGKRQTIWPENWCVSLIPEVVGLYQ